jgi:hypothetical protein
MGMAVLCVVVVAVGGYGLAGAADAPSLGSPIVVGPSPTTATVGAAGSGAPMGRRPTPASSTSTTGPLLSAVPVSPPNAQVAGDDDPADDLQNDREDARGRPAPPPPAARPTRRPGHNPRRCQARPATAHAPPEPETGTASAGRYAQSPPPMRPAGCPAAPPPCQGVPLGPAPRQARCRSSAKPNHRRPALTHRAGRSCPAPKHHHRPARQLNPTPKDPLDAQRGAVDPGSSRTEPYG